MSTSRVLRSLVVAAGICVLVGTGPGGRVRGQQTPPPQAEPTFRTDANYVLTDVFVTADGKPITDLTQADFEVKEDGVVQAIRSFEAVRHTAEAGALPRRNPSSVAESNAMAADPRRRVFVVFLDTFHVTRAGSMVVRQALQTFLKSALGADDLVAYMTPQMSGGDISFSTSTDPLLAYLDANPQWGLADERPGTETDAIERELQTCFCCNNERDAVWLALRSRLREQKSIDSLRGLVANLDGLRESRKAVIAVTIGWRLYRENDQRMTNQGTQGRIGGVQPVGVGPNGVLGTPERGRAGGSSQQTCDNTRLVAAYTDTQQLFQDLIGEANRSSTSFYTLDARGLRTEGRAITASPTGEARGATAPGTAVNDEMRNRDTVPYLDPRRLDPHPRRVDQRHGHRRHQRLQRRSAPRRRRLQFLLPARLHVDQWQAGREISQDQGHGEAAWRARAVSRGLPGASRRRRSCGVDVTRRGEPWREQRDQCDAEIDAQLTAALGRLTPSRPDVPLVVTAAAGAVPGGTARSIRVTAELDAAVAATPEWADGGEAQAFVRNAKGDTVTTGKAALPKGARTVEIEVPVVEGMTGDVKVQVRLSGNGALARYTDTTSVALDAMPAGWGAPRLSRRGPSTGVAWVPTADPRFRRQERLRVSVSVGAGAEAAAVTAVLLDRQGRPINVPVKVDQTAPEALVAELALAPLAAGDYVLALGGGPKRLLVPLRIVP